MGVPLLILSLALLIAWANTEQKIYGKILGAIWFSLFGLIIIGNILGFLTDPKKLSKKDYHGQYVIHRDYFSGPQADWQCNNFRFEIKTNDSIFFYVTDKEKIIQTYRGTVSTVKPYNSERLVLNMEQPTHHVLSFNPTTYRSAWSFYLVFYSPKFKNMYFKKAKWKPIG
jgi:hypothetical protein